MSPYSSREGEKATCKVSAKLQCPTRLEITAIGAKIPNKGAVHAARKGCPSNHSSQVPYARGELPTAAQLPHPTDLPATEDPNLAFGGAGLAAELRERQPRR